MHDQQTKAQSGIVREEHEKNKLSNDLMKRYSELSQIRTFGNQNHPEIRSISMILEIFAKESIGLRKKFIVLKIFDKKWCKSPRNGEELFSLISQLRWWR